MSKLRLSFAFLGISALAGLQTALAQQSAPVKPADPSPRVSQPERSPGDQPDRYETRRVPYESQGAKTVKDALVEKLQKANDAEIELAKLAQQKSDNQEVKQMAQTLIQDHQALNQKLEQFSQRRGSSSQVQNGNPSTSQSRTERQSDLVPQELCDVTEAACDNALKMTKDMLGKYEGQDFNMAFLGQQCVAHTMLLAELKAIESKGPKELQTIAQEAAEKVQMHLEKAKQLAKKLEDDRKSRS